jgi:transducin (beta)-like 1
MHFSSRQHQGPIFATRFSKSGRWLLTASLDGTACVWDVNEKKLQMQYRCHLDCCLDVDWIDENIFASCGADQLIHVMKLEESKPIRTLAGHSNEINQIKCNPSRTRLASCSDDQTARIWDISSVDSPDAPSNNQPEHMILKGHRHAVSSIGWCPDHPPGTNELVATSSFDGTARLWDSVTGECLKIFSDHKRPVYALSFSPEGQWLATGSGDGFLHIYNVKTKEKKWSWYAGSEKPGVFEIDWQREGNINRIALALECRQVGVVDITRILALQSP